KLSCRGAGQRCSNVAVSTIPRARHRGKKSNAAWSINWVTAWCSNPRLNISASHRNPCRATTTKISPFRGALKREPGIRRPRNELFLDRRLRGTRNENGGDGD